MEIILCLQRQCPGTPPFFPALLSRVYFWSADCKPCRVYSRVLQKPVIFKKCQTDELRATSAVLLSTPPVVNTHRTGSASSWREARAAIHTEDRPPGNSEQYTPRQAAASPGRGQKARKKQLQSLPGKPVEQGWESPREPADSAIWKNSWPARRPEGRRAGQGPG